VTTVIVHFIISPNFLLCKTSFKTIQYTRCIDPWARRSRLPTSWHEIKFQTKPMFLYASSFRIDGVVYFNDF